MFHSVFKLSFGGCRKVGVDIIRIMATNLLRLRASSNRTRAVYYGAILGFNYLEQLMLHVAFHRINNE